MDKGAPHQKTSLPYTLPTPRTFTTELANESELEVTGELELFVQGSVHSTPEFLVGERYHYSQHPSSKASPSLFAVGCH